MSNPRFWVYLENQVKGPVDVPALRKLNGFNLLTQVCQEGQAAWRMADEVIEIKSYFSSPPRVSALITHQNAQTIEVPETENILSAIELSVVETPGIASEEENKPEENSLTPNTDAVLQKLIDDSPFPKKSSLMPADGEEETLGKICPKCKKQNPLERRTCRACGVALEEEKTDAPNPSLESLTRPLPEPVSSPFSPSPLPSLSVSESAHISGSPLVEVPIRRIAVIITSLVFLGVIGFFGRKAWKKHQTKQIAGLKPALTLATSPPPSITPRRTRHGKAAHHGARSRITTPRHHGISHVRASPDAAAMPGISTPHETVRNPARPHAKASPPSLKSIYHEDSAAAPVDTGAGSYDIVTEAAPQRHRESAPLDSPYAKKHRGQKELWEGRGEEAIYLAQHQRTYGGRRTILRNTEILFQILRDREYMAAFESGQRLHLFNDMDWGANQIEGPLYEVQLTFSGGKETDGTSRQPLKFTFDVDLDRKTAQAGGSEGLRSNTMHGFFDESRIPPEERSAVAKDTEELVLAGQPEASPLALQTVVRQFVRTYSEAKLKQIAAAYGLDNADKVLVRDLPSAPVARATENPSTTPETSRFSISKSDIAPRMNPHKSTLGSLEFSLERTAGKERAIIAKIQSPATVARLWETVTGYDRFSQFIPDILVSQKEGQDGSATVLQTTSLSRFMFFVFKVNMHLHIVEHPYDHSLEFERIAGDFDSFHGTLSVASDPANPAISTISLNAKLVPKGFVPEWILRGMSERFITSVMNALRNRAEN